MMIYSPCDTCYKGEHKYCYQLNNKINEKFGLDTCICRCPCIDNTTGKPPLTDKEWANIRAQIQFAFLDIEDANDSNIEISSSITSHSDGTMTFAVYRWEGNVRKYVANIEMKLNYTYKKGLVIY